MTIDTSVSRSRQAGNGSTTTFTVGIKFFASDTLLVYLEDDEGVLTLKTEGVDYTVTGGSPEEGPPADGTVETDAFTVAADEFLVIERLEPYTQAADYERNDPFPAVVTERGMDRLAMQIQQVLDIVNRAPQLPSTRDPNADPLDLDEPAAGVAEFFLRLKSDLSGFEYAEVVADGEISLPVTVSNGGTGSTTAAAARTALGLAIGTDVQADLDVVSQADAEAGTATDERIFTALRVAQAIAALGTPAPRGHLAGLTLSNNGTDADHDIDVAVGEATDDSVTKIMKLTSAITKRIDATWSVGTNQGGLDTGTVANDTWYHVYEIERSDTGVVDVLFSTSASSPTMPTNYDLKRRIGAVLTDGSANIIAFSQLGDEFLWDDPPEDTTGSITDGNTTLATVTVPLGVQVRALLHAVGTSTQAVYVASPDASDEAPSLTAAPHFNAGSNGAGLASGPGYPVRTNTSSQVRVGVVNATGAVEMTTIGWYDRRGRDD